MLTETDLYNKFKNLNPRYAGCDYTLHKCEEEVLLVNEIEVLKRKKNAIVLAHSYVSPVIMHTVADFVGDSYELSKNAHQTDADIIVFAAVRFMAETAKVLNPEKTVLIPSRLNGCSLADSIDAVKVKKLRRQYPSHAFICYINTSAAVKALCDVTVTSSNVYKIVENFPNDKIFFLPDKLMGENLINEMKERNVNKEIKLYDGTCYVHEEYNPTLIDEIRKAHSHVKVLAHPECNSNVASKCDFVGSTSQMLDYVKRSTDETFFLLTECGLISRLEVERKLEEMKADASNNTAAVKGTSSTKNTSTNTNTNTCTNTLLGKQMVGSCTMCKYMKSNSLSDILRVLSSPQKPDIITLDEHTMEKARASILAMFHYA